MNTARRLLSFLAAAWLLFPAAASAAEELSTDISSHLVAIRSDFTGSQILLFGAITDTDAPGITGVESPEYDIVVVVRGPDVDLVERRKERVLGIWVNRASALFADIPGFYAVASTRPLGIINAVGGDSARGLFERNAIGIDNLVLDAVAARDDAPRLGRNEAEEYRAALLRHKIRTNLYGEQSGVIDFLGDSLFRTVVDLPARVPVGSYEIEVYLFKDGKVIDAQSLPLFVNKIGVGRYLFRAAHDNPFLYGLGAVIMALLIGWLAGILFERK